MSQIDERIRLLRHDKRPQYLFEARLAIERKRRQKQFQCCICAVLIFTFLVAVIATVSYGLNSGSYVPDGDAKNQLLTLSWPRGSKLGTPTYEVAQTEVDDALAVGKGDLQNKTVLESEMIALSNDSPAYRYQKINPATPKALSLARIGYIEQSASRYFNRKNGKYCYNCSKPTSHCDGNSKFRSYNGSCNNLWAPDEYGVAYTPFRRSLPPAYGDGIDCPRLSRSRKPLPSARTVSLIVHRPFYMDDPKFTVMLAVFGQFLDHDITATASGRTANGTTISCCTTFYRHPECYPVILDEFDPFREYGIKCMDFVRSAPAPTCCLGPREQLNQMSAFIDGSVIYGVDLEVVTKLRTFIGGELKMYHTEDNRTLLPISEDPDDGCNRMAERVKGRYCFMTGDGRANENLHLTSMHLLWARHHNAIARRLAEINPQWTDERLFQEARKIVGAQLQHITYNEFLPILLDADLLARSGLEVSEGYFWGYDVTIDPSIANSFAAAAFRFAHTIIPGLMKFISNDTASPEYVRMHTMLLDPFKLYDEGELDRIVRSAVDTTIQATDVYFSDELKQHLFERSDDGIARCGLDLVSLNIQRGRDHGLPAYNEWRAYCGLGKANNFRELQRDIDDDSLRSIETIYGDVDDIDLYTGALSERPLKGSILGPTLTCLILDQFVRLKKGDRFWYENPAIFTPEQLREIKKSSLAKIICDNSDGLGSSQRFVMESVRETDNGLIDCLLIDGPVYDVWKDQ